MIQVASVGGRRCAGFSLVEVLTGIGLTAVISFVAVPNASQFLGEYRLMSAANQLSFEIARARMQAVGQNVFVRVRMLDAGQYVRERSTDNVTFTQDGPVFRLPAGVTATTAEGGAPRFNRSGIANAASSITLSNELGYKTVRTNILGRVAISTGVSS
jgi:Tfp pilus assembly protein FimT